MKLPDISPLLEKKRKSNDGSSEIPSHRTRQSESLDFENASHHIHTRSTLNSKWLASKILKMMLSRPCLTFHNCICLRGARYRNTGKYLKLNPISTEESLLENMQKRCGSNLGSPLLDSFPIRMQFWDLAPTGD